jgi:hypothetical protein
MGKIWRWCEMDVTWDMRERGVDMIQDMIKDRRM